MRWFLGFICWISVPVSDQGQDDIYLALCVICYDVCDL